MGKLGLIIGVGALLAVVFFRRELGETGAFLGKGATQLGTGIGEGISGLFKPFGFLFGGKAEDRLSGRPDVQTIPIPPGTSAAGTAGPGVGTGGSGQYPCGTPGGPPCSGFAISGAAGPETRVQEIRYDGRVEGSNLIPIPGEPGGFYDPRFISDPRVTGRLN